MTMFEDENKNFWSNYSHDDLAKRCATLHQQRRVLTQEKLENQIMGSRYALSHIFVKGKGIEVGAGSRPFPIPSSAECFYGDIRDSVELNKYFKVDGLSVDGWIDAQTLQGVKKESLDFFISAHVIEHLLDPIGAIRVGIESLKPGGIFILVVPELTQTFDRKRPPTTLDHLVQDSNDGGVSTVELAYLEHCKFVHPEITGEFFSDSEVIVHAKAGQSNKMDIHVHAWRHMDMLEMLEYCSHKFNFSIEANYSLVNENLFVLRRNLD